MTSPAWHALRSFDGGDATLRVRAAVARADGRLALSYCIDGTATVRVPARVAPARVDRLWEHTCVEAFLAPVGGDAYWEVNLSPSGEWQVYRFDGPRRGMRADTAADGAVQLAVAHADGTCRVDASLASPSLSGVALDIGLSAVIESLDGTCTYWSLHHPAARPDFHDRAGFVLRLPGEAA